MPRQGVIGVTYTGATRPDAAGGIRLVRALRGRALRVEVYALNLDGELESPHPYTVAETNFTVRREQARGDQRYGVFFVHDRQSVTYGFERDPTDPRTAQGATLLVGPYGACPEASRFRLPAPGVIP